MSSELKKASAGGKFYGSILALLIFGALILTSLLVVRTWQRLYPSQNLDEKRAEARVTKREALEKDNAAKLTTYAWVNKDKGIVQIPIDRAMQLVVADLRAKQVQPSSVKVETPYPYGLQSFSFIPPPAAPAASGTAAPGKTGTAAPAGTGTAAPAASGTAAPAPAASGSTAPQPAATTAPK